MEKGKGSISLRMYGVPLVCIISELQTGMTIDHPGSAQHYWQMIDLWIAIKRLPRIREMMDKKLTNSGSVLALGSSAAHQTTVLKSQCSSRGRFGRDGRRRKGHPYRTMIVEPLMVYLDL